jgi:hypothetical protein
VYILSEVISNGALECLNDFPTSPDEPAPNDESIIDRVRCEGFLPLQLIPSH